MDKQRIISLWQQFAYESEISTHTYRPVNNPGQIIDLDPKVERSVFLPDKARSLIASYTSQEKEQKNPLYALFPLILGKEGTHIPVFAVNLSGETFKINENGYISLDPLSELDLHVNTGILLRHLDLEENDLPRVKSLVAFIEGILGTSTESLYPLMEMLCDAITQNAPHIKCRNAIRLDTFNPYTESLPSQLELIAKHPDVHIRQDNAAGEYFTVQADARPRPFDGKKLWLGGFDREHPLMQGQATVLQQMQDDTRLIAVQGAPGTGKTTLFLSLIAQEIIKRARSLAEGEDYPARIAIASTSNKAVQNAAERFIQDPEFATRNDFYFVAGNRISIKQSIERLERHIVEMKGVQKPTDEALEKAKTLFLKSCEALENHFDSLVNFYDDLVARLAAFGIDYKALAPKTRFDSIMQALDKREQEILVAKQQHEARYPGIAARQVLTPDKSMQESADRYRLHRQKVCEANRLLETASDKSLEDTHHVLSSGCRELAGLLEAIMAVPFWKIEFLFKTRRKLARSFFMGHSGEFYLSGVSLETFSESEASRIWQDLDARRLQMNELEAMRPDDEFYITYPDAYMALETYAEFKTGQEEVRRMRKFVESAHRDQGWQFDRYEDPATVLRLESGARQRELYDEALAFITRYRDYHADEVVKALENWKMLLESDSQPKDIKRVKTDHKSLREFDRLVSLSYPVLTSTLASFSNMFPKYRYGFVNQTGKEVFVDHQDGHHPVSLLLSDESGMCSAHALFPALCFSEKAVVVGDPLQLEPILSLAPVQIDAHENLYADSNEAVAFSPTQVSAYHRAAR